jgi:hypothetical protein
MKQLIIPLIAALLSTTAFTASADIYKWTDSSGKTHYSQTPPANVQAKDMEKELHIQSSKSSATKPEPKKTLNPEQNLPELPKDLETAKAQGVEDKQKVEKFCKEQEISLKQMLSTTLIRWKDEQGEHLLTAEERDAKIKEAEKNLSTICSPEVLGTKTSAADEKKE